MKDRKRPKILEAETDVEKMNFKTIKLYSNKKITTIKLRSIINQCR